MDIDAIQTCLNYQFNDTAWLKQAFTHPSVDQKKSTNLNYERLEYLGDALLELVVSRELFTLYPKADEGVLTQMRASVVSRKHLAGLASKWGFGTHLILSPTMAAQGGRETLSILANTFETVVGAVLMDSNYNAARKVSLHLLGDSLHGLEEVLVQSNPKGALLEILQGMGCPPPIYLCEGVNGGDDGPFTAKAMHGELELGSGQGTSKRKAEIDAATQALILKRWVQ